jgi:hypothetical protein
MAAYHGFNRVRGLHFNMKKFIIILSLALAGTLMADMPQGHVGFTVENFTANGTVKQGCWSLMFITSAGFTGNVNGAALASSTVYPNMVPCGARTNDISVVVSGGTLTCIEMR